MVWHSDSSLTYLMEWAGGTDGNRGSWAEQPPWDGSSPDELAQDPPPGRYEPKRGFGWVWRTLYGGPEGHLGWATAAETGFCANIQRFDRGLMFRSSSVQFCHPEYPNPAQDLQLYFSLYSDGTWIRH
jgi:hypothetical protein